MKMNIILGPHANVKQSTSPHLTGVSRGADLQNSPHFSAAGVGLARWLQLHTVATVTTVLQCFSYTVLAPQSGPGTMGAHTALVTVLTLSLAPLVTAAPRDLDDPSRGHHYVDRRSAEADSIIYSGAWSRVQGVLGPRPGAGGPAPAPGAAGRGHRAGARRQ